MLLKEGETTIASGFMDAALIHAREMVVNLQEMVVQVVCINIIINLFKNSKLLVSFLQYVP